MIRKRIMNIIGILLLIVLVGLLIYSEWSRWTSKKDEKSKTKMTEIELLLGKDMNKDYPKEPEEVIDYASRINKAMYSGAEDEEVESLAKRIILLYDDEFLANTSESKYLTDLYSEIAVWNNAGRTISNYIFINQDNYKHESIDGVDYATSQVSYTISEKGKISEVRKYLLRKDKDGKWKILGWEIEHKAVEE